MNRTYDETWRTVWLKAGLRLLIVVALYVPFLVTAMGVTILTYASPHEHPFQSSGQPHPEKFSAAFGANTVVPGSVVFGLIAGVLFAWRASDRVRSSALMVFGAALAVAGRTGDYLTTPWPNGLLALIVVAAAVLAASVVAGLGRWRHRASRAGLAEREAAGPGSLS